MFDDPPFFHKETAVADGHDLPPGGRDAAPFADMPEVHPDLQDRLAGLRDLLVDHRAMFKRLTREPDPLLEPLHVGRQGRRKRMIGEGRMQILFQTIKAPLIPDVPDKSGDELLCCVKGSCHTPKLGRITGLACVKSHKMRSRGRWASHRAGRRVTGPRNGAANWVAAPRHRPAPRIRLSVSREIPR